jgi:hypothetical protein
LIYIIYLLLVDEIDKLKSKEDYKYFLSSSSCGLFLSELIERKDIKAFFKIALKDVIETMEVSGANSEIILDPFIIEQNITARKNNQKKNAKKKGLQPRKCDTVIEKIRSPEEKKQQEIFYSKYAVDLPLKKIRDLKTEYNTQKNIIMENYIDSVLKGQTNEDIYSNKQFFNLMNKNAVYTYELLVEYKNSFMKVLDFIDSLLNSFLENIDLLPFSIRCVCKIISILLEKKFNDINQVEKNMFIAQFFSFKLLLPVIINPASTALISEYIISNHTLDKLNTLSTLLSYFFNFRLFSADERPGYTPLNAYYLESTHKLMKVYDNFTKVQLPSFIEKLISGEINSNDYEYNYFQENKNEILFHRSILLTVNHIKPLINNLNKIQQISPECKMIYDKIENSEDIPKLCKENEKTNKIIIKANKAKGQKKEEKMEQQIKFFLISDLIFNEKNQKLFLNNESRYFKLEEKKKKKDENKENIENIIIKAKNIISILLYNYRALTETDFQEKEMTNTLEIFKKLKVLVKSADSVVDDRIPNGWYIESLYEYLKKLPPEYKENDYRKLYDELRQDIEKSIKKYNFEELSIVIDKKIFCNKIKDYYNKAETTIKDIILNKGVKDIVEKDEINVKIFFKYNDEKKELNIYQEDMGDKQLDFLDSFIFVDVNQKAKLCKTIESFIKHFPDLNRYVNPNSQEKETVFDIERKLNVPKQLTSFFKIVHTHLGKKMKNEEWNNIYDKVYDYVMSKIHHKIYPTQPNPKDDILYKKIQSFSWIEPGNIKKNLDNYNFELVLPEITRAFNYINIEKSPKKKIENMQNIFGYISQLLSFSQDGSAIGVDDQMPLLNYVFIRAKPKGIYTDMEFPQLYMGDKQKKKIR